MRILQYQKIILGFILINIMLAQDEVKSIGIREYGKWDRSWYTIIKGEKGNLVDIYHLIVKRKEGQTMASFDFLKADVPRLKDNRGRYAGGFYELIIPEGADPFSIGEKLVKTNEFDHVFMNTYSSVSTHIVSPNDTMHSNQWNLSKIKMQHAWNYTKGSNTIKVAVIDMGIDLNHPDLNNNIDAVNSRTFLSDDTSAYPENGNAHGTMVAGIIAAELNNSIGIAGMAGGWGTTKGVSLIALQAGPGPFGDISNSAAADAFDWADSIGVDIINCSWNSKKNETIPPPDLNTAINNAENSGIIIVFSSGNIENVSDTSNSEVRYPASKSEVIAVGATTIQDYRKNYTDSTDIATWGSRYGPKLDVVAPGIYISTTDISGTTGNSTGDYYSYFNGTSAAAPHVSALAALVLSHKPTLTANEVKSLILNNAGQVHSGTGYNYTYGFNQEVGNGRIDVSKTLDAIYPLSVTVNGPGDLAEGGTGTWSANVIYGGSGTINYAWDKKNDGSTYWYPLGSSQTQSLTMSSNSFTIRVTVHIGTQYSDDEKYIYRQGSGGFPKIRSDVLPVPDKYNLYQNHPNPFNPTTTIKYELPEPSSVRLVVYDLRGNELKTWENGNESPGFKQINWQATDTHGNKVPAGIYIYKLTATSHETNKVFSKSMKMVLMK